MQEITCMSTGSRTLCN